MTDRDDGQAGGDGAGREAGNGAGGEEPEGDGASPRTTPLSVREVMGETEAPRKEADRTKEEERAEGGLASGVRALEDPEGRRWWVVTAGATLSGWPTDAGAPLLLLAFRPDDPGGEPTREAMAVARSLADLTDDELLRLLAERSRPYRDAAALAPKRQEPSRGNRSRRPRGGR